ncbi:hypothetical protein QFW77_15420 [Luteimonas sp. RD2P54]|uniref:Toxin CptA n=1 Tax=Luteimonas endophytica TaxID=3042023 RepID=A0ABT6JCM6_9GAMM|nr:hypothetical protein [Luteimonas endophytica]MDH5824362.1 hypothetical protein [Luteimonas endophytica]
MAMLAAMALLAPLAVLASELPPTAAWPLALAALAHGILLLRREARRPGCVCVFGGDGRVWLDGAAVDRAWLRWRGPLAFLECRDGRGRVRRLAWWPDTLPPARRRELRLAAPGPRAARRGSSMAP